jgi:SNF family Na+-dependent transporter
MFLFPFRQDPNVWRKAAEQMFYSLSVSWGGLIMFGSYNKFDHKAGHLAHQPLLTAASITSIFPRTKRLMFFGLEHFFHPLLSCIYRCKSSRFFKGTPTLDF